MSRSVTELTLETIRRIEHDRWNAFISIDRRRAIDAAKSSDLRVNAASKIGPLDGVVIAVKDCIDLDGSPTTSGSAIYRDRVAPQDALVVRRLKAAGAVIVGKTNMTELACGTLGDNDFFGDVENPLRRGHYPGGSSSGSAAAVAAGLVQIALGTDTTCSIRMPAAACGVVGLKPTIGRVPNQGVDICYASMDHVGPIGANVNAVADMLAVIEDPQHHGANPAETGSSVKGKRIAVTLGEFVDRCDPDVLNRFTESVEMLRNLGCHVGEVDLGVDLVEADAQTCAFGKDLVDAHGPRITSTEHKVSPSLSYWLDVYDRIGASAHQQARKYQIATRQHVSAAMSQWDAVICPTTRTVAGTWERGRHEPRQLRDANCLLWAITGQPSLSLPIGAGANGMPVGLLITGRLGEDHTVLRIGQALESCVK